MEQKPNSIELRKAALALNLCTVSVSQIIDYEDINILRQEYDAILNNINLQEIIKDEALLNAIKSILDTLTFYMIQNQEKTMFQKEYEHNLKNALASAFRPTGMMFVGGSPLGMAVAAVAMVGTGYLNYRSAKSQAKFNFEKEQWKLQRSAIEQLHGLRKSLFETAWRLSDTYNFPDEWRLTEKQITRYNAILMEPDPHKRYDRLDVLSSKFAVFPSFWYYKSRAALEAANKYRDNATIASDFKKKSLAALTEYDEAFRPLMREDIIASQAALDKIAMLDRKKDKTEIQKLLNRAEDMAGENYDVLQLCAIHYLNIAEASSAIRTLRILINENYNVYLNGRMLSRVYRELDNRPDFELLVARVGDHNVLPWTENADDAFALSLQNKRDRIQMKSKILFTRYFELSSDALIQPLRDIMTKWQMEPNLKKRIALCENLALWAEQEKAPITDMINAFVTDKRYMAIWNEQSITDDSKEFAIIKEENSSAISQLGEDLQNFKTLGDELQKALGFWREGCADGMENKQSTADKFVSTTKKSLLHAGAFAISGLGGNLLVNQKLNKEIPEENKYIEFGNFITNKLPVLNQEFAKIAVRYPLLLLKTFCEMSDIDDDIFERSFNALEILTCNIHEMEEEHREQEQGRMEVKSKYYFMLNRSDEE